MASSPPVDKAFSLAMLIGLRQLNDNINLTHEDIVSVKIINGDEASHGKVENLESIVVHDLQFGISSRNCCNRLNLGS